jgi:hypothetical protein
LKEETVQKKNLILGAALALVTQWGAAQTVWRCGNSYSQQPCDGGSAVAAPQSSTAAEARQAAAATRADAQRAQALEQARLAQEKNAPKAIVIGPVEPAPKPVADKRGAAPKAGKLEQFTATAPGKSPDKKKKN